MSWQQLGDIAKQNRQEWAQQAQMPPRSCPRCGAPLKASPKRPGILNCEMGDYRWPSIY